MNTNQLPHKQPPQNIVQSVRFFGPRVYIQGALHVVMLAALALTAAIWAGPIAFAVGSAVAALYTYSLNKASDRPPSNGLRRWDPRDTTTIALQKIIDPLTRRAGLKRHVPIYDFDLAGDEVTNSSGKDAIPVPQIRRILNAAAMGNSNPALIVSAPLMRLLNPDEAEAVLAHEIGHIGTRHMRLIAFADGLKTTAMLTAFIGMGHVMLATSIAGTITVAAGYFITQVLGIALRNNEGYTDEESNDKRRKLRFRRGLGVVQEAIGFGLLAQMNLIPVIAALAIEQGIFWGGSLVSRSLSRRCEFQADRDVPKLKSSPLAMITGLRKLDAAVQRDEPKLYADRDYHQGSLMTRAFKRAATVFSTHPNTGRRIRALARIARHDGYSEDAIIKAVTGPVDISALPPVVCEPQAVERVRASRNDYLALAAPAL